MTHRITEQDLVELINKFPKTSFTNIHGEVFNVHSNGTAVFLSGDEVDMMVEDKDKLGSKYIHLFNPSFSMWDSEELHKLGKALQKLHES